jgi:hypothetical protein
VRTAALLGLSTESIASLLRDGGFVSPTFSGRTLLRMKERDPAVRQAIEAGRAKGEYHIAQTIWSAAIEGNLGACYYWERTRCGRSDKQQVQLEHQGAIENNMPEVVVYLPDNGRAVN